MNHCEKTAFFDDLAEKWDGLEDMDALALRLASGLERLGVGPHETIVDVGCGTGNLVRAILPLLSAQGRVIAVDVSHGMLEAARRKIQDHRVAWHRTDARCLPVADAACDRVICLSVWPHLEDCGAVLEEFRRVLRPGGSIHVWHLASREDINALHASSDAPVQRDLLPPAEHLARFFEGHGFRVTTALDEPHEYQVSADRLP